jgi:membrane protein EpsK
MLSFGVSTLIAVWFTPYLIGHLGTAAYGLIPLVTTVVSYLGVITLTLNGAVGRFLTIALERQDPKEANRVFNTALFGNFFIVGLLLAPAVIISWHAEAWFNVPPGYERSISWLFLLIVCSFFVTTVETSFSLASFCQNRFDLSSAVAIASNLIRVGAVVLLFNQLGPEIWHIGIGAVLAVLISIIASIIIWRHLTPMLHIQPHSFDLKTLRQLTTMGGWFFLGQVGVLLMLSIELIIVNKMFGAKAGGQYGAVLQWSVLIRSLAGVIAGVFGPTIFMFYARNDIAGLVGYSQKAVKFLGLMIALPIGIVCGFSSSLLFVWLGPEFVSLAPLMSLMTIHLSVNLGVLPLFNIRVATKKVRIPAIVVCISGVLNVGLALFLAGPVGWGIYGVAAAGAIILTSVNMIFGPWYAAHILNIPAATFFRGTLPNILFTLGLTASCWAVSQYFEIDSWLGLITCGGAIAIVYVGFVFSIMLTKSERDIVVSVLSTYRDRASGRR